MFKSILISLLSRKKLKNIGLTSSKIQLMTHVKVDTVTGVGPQPAACITPHLTGVLDGWGCCVHGSNFVPTGISTDHIGHRVPHDHVGMCLHDSLVGCMAQLVGCWAGHPWVMGRVLNFKYFGLFNIVF